MMMIRAKNSATNKELAVQVFFFFFSIHLMLVACRQSSAAAMSKYKPNIMSNTFLISGVIQRCITGEKKISNRSAEYRQCSLKDLGMALRR